MKKIIYTVFYTLGALLLFQACADDDSALVTGEPDSVVNNDPEGSPLRGLSESWNGHDEDVLRQYFDVSAAVYYDPEVDRSIEWPFTFFSDSWGYIVENYGTYGQNSLLYVVGHGEADKSSFYKTHFEEDAENRSLIDLPIVSTEAAGTTLDAPVALMAQIVENSSNGVHKSPAAAVWGDKFTEIFTYDLYVNLGLDAEAERVKTAFEANATAYPNADTYWFRDWFLPIYENYNGGITLNNFFKILAANYPIDGTDYARDMTLGELVHFFSGATGEDLEPLAVAAFGFNDANQNELLQARAEFPNLNYPFDPASELIDVTSEGNASIVVSRDHPNGPDSAEGSLKVIDNDYSTKFLTNGFPQEFYMQQNFEVPQVVNKYTFTSGNDAPDRDFKTWELLGSNDGANFDLLDTRTDQTFTARNQTREFTFDNDQAYRYYRINVLANNGSTLIQLTEWRLLNLKLLTFGPQDITATATTTVSRENRNGADSNEASIRVTDGDLGTKFLLFDFNNPEWIQQEFVTAQRVTKYTLTSANDAPGRDPVEWTLSGSNDGTNFTVIDTRTSQSFESRGQTREFLVTNENSYTYYRLDILANGGDGLFQLAEWRLFAE